MKDAHVAALLDELTPTYDDRFGEWARVAADARQTKRARVPATTRWRVSLLAAAVVATTFLLLSWPFQDEHGTVLDRALAAVGSGPVLHTTLRGEWGGTLVDLATGERKPVYGDNEIWFDTETSRTHQIDRLGDVVQDEELYTPNRPRAELEALGREYRRALESGSARVAEEDTIDGQRVAWITVHSELLPDVADGKDHEWAQQIAVSKNTYKPVALRETRDGKPGPGTLQRVLDLQMLPRDDADFTPSRPSLNGTAFKQGRKSISREEARTTLGRTPLWLGASYDGLPLAHIYEETTSVGHARGARITGAKAAAANRCSEHGGSGDCFRRFGPRQLEVAPDGVFTIHGPLRWRRQGTSVILFYGSVGDDPSTYLEHNVPLYDKPYLTVSESTHASAFRRGVGTYVPPEGSLFITAGRRSGYLQRDGLQIGIDAVSEASLVAAARALTPMP